MRLRSLDRRVRKLEAERAAAGEVRVRGMAGLLRALDALDDPGAAGMAGQPPDALTGLLAGAAADDGPEGNMDAATAVAGADAAHG